MDIDHAKRMKVALTKLAEHAEDEARRGVKGAETNAEGFREAISTIDALLDIIGGEPDSIATEVRRQTFNEAAQIVKPYFDFQPNGMGCTSYEAAEKKHRFQSTKSF